MGDRAAIRQQITSALPAIQFHREASGPDKIAAARAAGWEFPEILRRHLEQRPATERAEFEGEGFSVELYGFEANPLDAIHTNVRGSGDPVPVLAALCRPHGWVAIDDASGQPVDLAGADAAGWDSFRAYRDRAIRSFKKTDSAV
jgi:hypothetical protein